MLISLLLRLLFVGLAAALVPRDQSVLNRTYIIRLTPESDYSNKISRQDDLHISSFHKQASGLDYTVRYEFKNPDVFLGISIQATGDRSDEDVFTQLQALPGVESVSRVAKIGLPTPPDTPPPLEPFLSYSQPPQLNVSSSGKLASTLEMGGVDKLHTLGIKGKGVKIGIVDTGVDYRHPALGGGIGSGYKIAGGYSFITDDGAIANSSDPLTTCYGGGHGTHVAGIIGMDPAPGGFDITGVAPEATIYMYKALDCTGYAAGDTILTAMSKAHEDGVDIVSMSIGAGPQSFSGALDPFTAITKSLTDAGIAVIVANGNDASGGPTAQNLYSEEWPSTEPSAIGVGAIANTVFPLVYSAVDSLNTTIQYASVYPIELPNGADIYIMNDGCDSSEWDSVLSTIDVNNTVVAFQEIFSTCLATSAGSWKSSPISPVYIMAFTAHTTDPLDHSREDPYHSAYDTPSQGFFGATQFINVNSTEGDKLVRNFNATGGYGKYKWTFSVNFSSPVQPAGGLMDYYSSYGPTWHDYLFKPQISAPGGHVLSTWPLGSLGGYAILSGTSMATPYISGAFALVKSRFPKATNQEILERLQSTATPLPWIYDTSILAATPQQGAGLVNVYSAIFSNSTVSPAQLIVTDVSHTEYGIVNITIENSSAAPKTYSFTHKGAAYMDYTLKYQALNQRPLYGSSTFTPPGVVIPPGQSSTVRVSISPPDGVDPTLLPVFSGFLSVSDSDGETLHVPYVGPPYSLYNAPYLLINNTNPDLIFPRVWSYAANNSIVVDYDLGEFVASRGYGSNLETLQWTREFRVDVLPANTNITADHYGFGHNVTYPYIPSQFTPNTTVFGYPSFGTLINETGYIWPGSNGQFGTDTGVTSSNGVRYEVGNGDYRWFVSVLRWGGTSGNKKDYDTWLGPVIRFISANSTSLGRL